MKSQITKAWRVRTILIASFLLLYLFVIVPPRAGAATCVAGGCPRWPNAYVEYLYSENQFPNSSPQYFALLAASNAWKNAPGTKFQQNVFSYREDSKPDSTPTIGNGLNEVGFCRNASFGFGEVSRTYFSSDSSVMLEADVCFNPNVNWNYDTNPVYPDPNNRPSFALVALHEFGHGLGLGHTNDVPSIMSSKTDSDHRRLIQVISDNWVVQPYSDDLAGSRSLYGHGPSELDFAVSAFRPDEKGSAEPWEAPLIPLPVGTDVTPIFTVLNRGNVSPPEVTIAYFLSKDRKVGSVPVTCESQFGQSP